MIHKQPFADSGPCESAAQKDLQISQQGLTALLDTEMRRCASLQRLLHTQRHSAQTTRDSITPYMHFPAQGAQALDEFIVKFKCNILTFPQGS